MYIEVKTWFGLEKLALRAIFERNESSKENRGGEVCIFRIGFKSYFLT